VASNLSPTLYAPFRCECFPVRIVARLGVQMLLATNALRKIMPSRAMRSMFGVLLMREP
jgi:hypothetical protein